jgi:hypothetical protein
MSGERTRGWGEFVEDIADERALETFSGAEPLTTAEIAAEMNTTEHTARGKLEALASKGALESKVLRQETAPLTVWYLPREAHAHEIQLESEVDDPEERAEELIESFDVPGASEMMHSWRRDAIRAAYEHLQEAEQVRATEFCEEVYPRHSASYDDTQAWWAMVRDRLKQLPGVVGPTWGGETWCYDDPTTEADETGEPLAEDTDSEVDAEAVEGELSEASLDDVELSETESDEPDLSETSLEEGPLTGEDLQNES